MILSVAFNEARMTSRRGEFQGGRNRRGLSDQQGWRNEQNGRDYGGHGVDQGRYGGNHGEERGGHYRGRGGWRGGHYRGSGGHRGNQDGYGGGRVGYDSGRGSENSEHGSENSVRDNCQARAQFMSDDKLQTLSQSGPDETLAFASQNEYQFLNTFKRKHYCNHPLKLKQMIKLLCLLVRSEDKRFAAAMLAQTLCADGKYAGFMVAIDLLLKKMPIEHRDFIKRENVTCIGHLVEIGLVAIEAVPASVLYTFPLLVL